MSFSDFSKILELFDIKNQLRSVKDDHSMAMTQRSHAVVKFEDELKRVQLQIRTLRSYINDGQKKLDSLPEKYAPMIHMKDHKIQEMQGALDRLEAELKRQKGG